MCVLACQDQHTLPKWNILSSCYCGLLSLLVCVPRTSTPSQSEIFSQAVIVACSLCSYVCIGLPGPAHPPKVKYSLKLLLWLALSARMYVLACQDQHTLPKWNILSSCYCGLLSLLVCMYWPARTSTPSQSEIFSQAVIVACSLCSYVCIGLPGPAHPPKVKYSLKLLLWLALSARMCVLACQDQHTLPKWNILSSCYCGLLSLLVCVYWPARTSTPSQSEIFSQSCYCGLFVWSFLSGPAHPPKVFSQSCYCGLLLVCCPARKCEIFCQRYYFCLFYVLAFQDQRTLPKWNFFVNISSACCTVLIWKPHHSRVYFELKYHCHP